MSKATGSPRAEGVRALKTEYERRAASLDADGLAALYAEDAVRLPPDAPALSGRDAIRAAWADALAGLTAIEDRGRGRFVVRGALAHEVGTYHIHGVSRDGVSFQERGRYITTFRRTGGTWRITAEIWRVMPPCR